MPNYPKTRPAVETMPATRNGVGPGELHPALVPAFDRLMRLHQEALPTIPKYERMRQAIAEVRRVDEAKDIKDKADALRAYARMRHDVELEMWLTEIKLRAIRRIGELSRDLEKFPGRPRKNNIAGAGKNYKASVLKKAGISTSAAHRAEKISDIPFQQFEALFTTARAERKVVTIEQLLLSVGTRQKVDRRARGLGWRHELEHSCAPDTTKPNKLQRLRAQIKKNLSVSQRFQLLLIMLADLSGETATARVTFIEKWYLKLLVRLIDQDAIEAVLERIFELPRERDRERYLENLVKEDDEPFLAVHPADDLRPFLNDRKQ